MALIAKKVTLERVMVTDSAMIDHNVTNVVTST